jgi:glutathione S-transferase
VQAEIVHIDLSNKPAWYQKINPRGLVPALRHGGKTLTESLDLCHYIENQFPGPALMPAAEAEGEEVEGLIDRCDQWVSAVSDIASCLPYMLSLFHVKEKHMPVLAASG